MKNNVRSIVYVVEDVNTAQFRYRVKNVIDALADSKEWRAKYVLKNEALEIDLKEVDILVVLRQTAKDNTIPALIKKARTYNIKVLFDLDDLIFDYRDLRLVFGSVQEKNLLYWLGYFWGIRRIAKRVDGFLCTNEYLGKKLERSFRKPYKVIRNSLSKSQINDSERIIKTKKDKKNFTMGYFSGSSTHKRDFSLVEPDLIRLLKTHDDVKLRIVGEMSYSDEMKKLITEGEIETTDKVDYLKLLELISEVDVNLAPLVVNDFTNCKSELKFFEAAVVETTTIASPTFTFKKAVDNGKNGFLAKPGEWFDKLDYLYKNTEENKKIARKAREYALKHYYGKEFLKEIEEVFESYI